MIKLSTSPTRNEFDTLVKELSQTAEKFHEKAKDNLQADIASSCGDWLKSPKADKVLSAWARDIVAYLENKMPGNGPTGHDRRHLAKDLATGLLYNPDNNPMMFLCTIPSWLHDIGRLVEAAFKGVIPYSESSPKHALFSFGIAAQFMSKPYFGQIPEIITDHILHAILEHTKPSVPTQMLDVVGAADRHQLVGPEGVARLFAVQTALGLPLIHPNLAQRATMPQDRTGPNLDAAHAPEFYLRNLYPQCSPIAQKLADDRKADSAAFLMLGLPEDYQQQTFAPELRCASSGTWAAEEGEKRIIPYNIWQEAQRRAQETRKSTLPANTSQGLEQILAFMYDAPGTASHPEDKQAFIAAYHALPPNAQHRMEQAFDFLQAQRKKYDAVDLANLTPSNTRPEYVNILAQWAYNQLAPQ